MQRHIDGFIGAVMPGMGNHFALAARFFDDDFQHALALDVGQRPKLAHHAATEHAIDAQRICQMTHVTAEAGLVNAQAGRKRRSNRSNDATKRGT